MNLNEIAFLAGLMKQNDLTLLKITEGNIKIKLERNAAASSVAPMAQGAQAAATSMAPTQAAVPAPATDADCAVITAPMIGVFYAAPSPEAQPFVTIGSPVQKGDVLCILEAMKLMNEVVAETDGVVADICLKTGEVAEYGQPIFKIRRDV